MVGTVEIGLSQKVAKGQIQNLGAWTLL